ncbi:MAG: dihydrofolate reductase [Bacteroidetes bacterium]|nr:dihydrofolate reductase [Bacteroidota bacterium]
MRTIIIAAMNRRRVIGRNGALPWRLPEDLQRFRSVTMGGTLLMGRRTFASIGRPLDGRRTIVLSRTLSSVEGAEVAADWEQAMMLASGAPVLFIAGGAEVYRAALERADELHLTVVDDASDGDAFFPPYEHLIGTRYQVLRSEQHTGYRLDILVRSDGTPASR